MSSPFLEKRDSSRSASSPEPTGDCGSTAPGGLLSCFEGVGFAIPTGIAAVALACPGVAVFLDSMSEFHSSGVSPASPVGWVAILGAFLLYGSFGILIKAPSVKKLGAGPNILQIYINFGVSLTFLAWCVLLLQPSDFWKLSWWGFLGGVLWPLLTIFATVGICSLGYSIACTVWAGVTISVSFAWGSVVFGQPLRWLPGSVLGLVVLFLGIVVSAASSEVQRRYQARSETALEDVEGQARSLGPSAAAAPKLRGFVSMMVGALFNGSLNSPYHLFANSAIGLSASAPELAYLVSFVLGMLACTVGLVIFAWATSKQLHCKTLLVPGALTGFYWACGYICALYATKYLGNNVGYPLCQTAIIISGLWGILYYKEITASLAIWVFAVSVALIIGGATMLANWAVV